MFEVNKTIAATGVENEFDVTLSVNTTYEIKEIKISEDIATVLVIDVSGSMAWCSQCGEAQNHSNHGSGRGKHRFVTSRLDKAKEAALAFLETYSDSATNSTSPEPAKRWLSIVTFSSGAEAKKIPNTSSNYWVEVSNKTGANYENAKNVINSLQAAGWTNIDAGLMLARNLLRTNGSSPPFLPGDDITNVNVVLLTDGEANAVAPSNTTSLNRINDQNDTSVNTAETRASTRANEIKAGSFTVSSTYNKKPATLYTIGYGEAKNNWLKNNIASSLNTHYSAANAEELQLAFQQISRQIELLAHPWSVTDPMGKFILWDEDENTEENNPALKHVIFNSDTNTLLWDLVKANKEGAYTDEGAWRKFVLTYRIRLDTTFDFVAEQAYATNGETTLYYVVESDSSLPKQNTVPIDVPQVKGYRGAFDFIKKGADGVTLDGYQFNLIGAGSQRPISSVDNGRVSFSDLPSGYSYTLTEDLTVNPHSDHYDINKQEYDVVVRYGEVFVFEKDADKTNANVLAHFGADPACRTSFEHVNPYIKLDIPIKKVVTGTSGFRGETFHFGLFKVKKGAINGSAIATASITVTELGTAEVAGFISVPQDQLIEIAKSDQGVQFIIAEIDEHGEVLTSEGEWQYASEQVITITSDRKITYGNGNTATQKHPIVFTNNFTKHYPLKVNYYLDGEQVRDGVPDSIGKFEPGQPLGSGAVSQVDFEPAGLKIAGKLPIFVKGNLTYDGADPSEYAYTINDAKTAVQGFNMPTETVYLNLYFRTQETPNVTITKAFGDLIYDRRVKTQPSDTFNFTLSTDTEGMHVVANASVEGQGTEVFTFVNNWAGNLTFPVTLYLHEVNLVNWTSNIPAAGLAYVTINENYGVEAIEDRNFGVAVNNYEQPPTEAQIRIKKEFAPISFGDDQVAKEFFEEYYGAELICDLEEVEGEDGHEHGPECYQDRIFTFEFGLEKLRGGKFQSTDEATVKIELSSLDLLGLVNSGSPITKPIEFTVPAVGNIGGVYRIVEVPNDHPGWGAADPVYIHVNQFGRVTRGNHKTMRNVYDAPVIPSLTILKYFTNERTFGTLPEETFIFEIATNHDFEDSQVVELSRFEEESAEVTIHFAEYPDMADAPPSLYVREVVGDKSEITYDKRIFELTLDRDEGEYFYEGKPVVFENTYKQTVFPHFQVLKVINKTFDQDQTFIFEWEASALTPRAIPGDDLPAPGEEISGGRVEITLPAGQRFASEDVDLSNIPALANYTGEILVREVIPDDGDGEEGPWVYDKVAKTLNYREGLARGHKVIFRNNYYAPQVAVSKDAGGIRKAIRHYQPVTFTIDVNAGASSERLTRIVVTDTAFKGASVESLNLKVYRGSIEIDNPYELTELGASAYDFDEEEGCMNFGDLVLARDEHILITYSLMLTTSENYYHNEARVEAQGKDSDWEVRAEADSEVELADSYNTPHVLKQVALLNQPANRGGYSDLDYQSTLENLGDKDQVVFRIRLWATGSDYGPQTAEYEFSDILRESGQDFDLRAAIAAENGQLTERGGKYYISLPVNGPETILYYVYSLPSISATGMTITNTAGLDDQHSTATIDVHGLDVGLRLHKAVAAYNRNTPLADYVFTDSVSFNRSGQRAIFRVGIASDQVIEISGLADVFDGSSLDKVLVVDGESGDLVEIALADLVGEIGNEDELVFYYISGPLNTNNKAYRNQVSLNWKHGAYYGQESAWAQARTAWRVTPPDVDPVYFTVTVNYCQEGSTDKLADSVIVSKLAGSDYDATDLTKLEIEDFERVRVEGPVSGFLRGNVVINVYYDQVEEIPDEEIPGGDTDPEQGDKEPGDKDPVDPDDGEEIPDEKTPGGGPEIPSAGGFVDTAVLVGGGGLLILLGLFYSLRKRRGQGWKAGR